MTNGAPGAIAASISGSFWGIQIQGGVGSVVNDGMVTGGYYSDIAGFGSDGAIILGQGGTVINGAPGVTNASISGVAFGISISGGSGTVVNDATITTQAFKSSTGVRLSAGGSVTNAAAGLIAGAGAGAGVAIAGGAGTISNAGLISGGVSLASGFTDLLIVDPGAKFVGQVAGGNKIGVASISTLELASGASAGTLSGLGSQYIDFAQTTIDAGASWTLTDTNTIAAGATLTELTGAKLTETGTLENDGAIVLDPSTLTVAGLTGTGSVAIDAGSTLDAQGTVASGETIRFAGSGAYLHLDTPDSANGSVTNFDIGETIDLKGVAASSVALVGANLVFTGGSFPLALANGGTIQALPSSDGAEVSVLCFCANTLILTPSDERPVQDLTMGDHVLTADGTVRPVRWIGRRHLDLTRHPNPSLAQPIRIRADAFASGAPRRDLQLSPEHAVLLDCGLIPVRLLVNGASILREDDCQSVTYYHVELDTHDILLAEALPAESYLDTGNRGMFENADVPLILHPTFDDPQARRVGGSCRPFVVDAAMVEPIWRRLATRAVSLGFILPREVEATNDPRLHVVLGDRKIKPVQSGAGRYTFVLPRTDGRARLVSRAARPCDTRPWLDDRRRLGVMVSRLTLKQGTEVTPIPVDHPQLSEGWWSVERDRDWLWRWTDGNAVIPLSAVGPAVLEIALGGSLDYPLRQPSGNPLDRGAAAAA